MMVITFNMPHQGASMLLKLSVKSVFTTACNTQTGDTEQKTSLSNLNQMNHTAEHFVCFHRT